MVIIHQLVTGIVHAVRDVRTYLGLGDLGAFLNVQVKGLVHIRREGNLGQAVETGGEQVGTAQEGFGGILVHVAVTDGLSGGHDVGGNLAVLEDLAPQLFTADLRLGGVGLGGYRARDVAEHGSQFIVIPGAEEEGFTHHLLEVRNAAVGQGFDGSVGTGDTLVPVYVEVIVHVGAEVQQEVFGLHGLVVLAAAAQHVVRGCEGPEEMVCMDVVADGDVQVVVDTREHLVGIHGVHREVAAVLGPIVRRVEERLARSKRKSKSSYDCSVEYLFHNAFVLNYLTIHTATRLDSGVPEASRSRPTALQMIRLAATPACLSISTTDWARCSESFWLMVAVPVPLSA